VAANYRVWTERSLNAEERDVLEGSVQCEWALLPAERIPDVAAIWSVLPGAEIPS